MSAEGPVGWYGKIASLGDFASRRLPPAFLGRWDAWLQQVIETSREQLGEAWLQHYLSCPVWHFILLPGVCGNSTWAGVMMPSVDRVGRYFPLTIVGEIEGFPNAERAFADLRGWLDSLQALALSTLHARLSAESFDETVAAVLSPPRAVGNRAASQQISAALQGGEAALLTLSPDQDLAPVLTGAGAIVLGATLRDSSLWWTTIEPGNGTPLLACRGLPDTLQYAAMLQCQLPRHA